MKEKKDTLSSRYGHHGGYAKTTCQIESKPCPLRIAQNRPKYLLSLDSVSVMVLK